MVIFYHQASIWR